MSEHYGAVPRLVVYGPSGQHSPLVIDGIRPYKIAIGRVFDGYLNLSIDSVDLLDLH
jgi:hypothetical protein